MYANDYNERLPVCTAVEGGVGGPVLWWDMGADDPINDTGHGNGYGCLGLLAEGWRAGQAKYITNPEVFFCQDFADTAGYGNAEGVGLQWFYQNFEIPWPNDTVPWGVGCDSNYTLNGNSNGNYWGYVPPYPVDGPYGSGTGKLPQSQTFGFPCAIDAYYPPMYNHLWHGQVLGFNVLYFDGSVKWQKNSGNVLTNAPSYNTTATSYDSFWDLLRQK
jgi:prepilin-type processing-associated H-X9-DG protein